MNIKHHRIFILQYYAIVGVAVFAHLFYLFVVIEVLIDFVQIDAEDYTEALFLAKKFNLDTDLVYKRQWQNAAVCKYSIDDYLVSIFII